MNHLKKLSRAQLKSYSKLTLKKYRQIERMFIVEGERSVHEALSSDWEIEALILTEGSGSLIDYSGYKHIPIYKISEIELKTLSDTVSSQGIIAIVKQKDFPLAKLWENLPPHPILVGLDDVSDPGNVGTIIRTCDWYGITAVFLGGNTVEIYNQKVVRSTMGSLFHIPVITEIDIIDVVKEARSRGINIITTVVEKGKPLPEFQPPEKSFIIFGNEAHGISPAVKELADSRITIPKYGNAESLNVGVSVGIILHHFCMSRA
jgi:TrmH family RNA methyltransferase